MQPLDVVAQAVSYYRRPFNALDSDAAGIQDYFFWMLNFERKLISTVFKKNSGIFKELSWDGL
jgi:hypothetical protein